MLVIEMVMTAAQKKAKPGGFIQGDEGYTFLGTADVQGRPL
ncbi:MAG: hypothetical protein QGG23_01945 [Candidatus Bathyarchaeota archaeon]|jgi:hypothetical protein|nr:hypothetical protein [Candidatus Bathyarchaeota archaeon]MDP7443676.1 hypothetical protein [Candidatus Bathyarchaeota archaeon]|tara:strand:+ start:498 stop:620 length:123 start_codon:yes stop_codon:yes gene_type:complete